MPKVVRLNPTQELFLFSLARYCGYIGGVGSGKTAAGAMRAVTKINQGEPGIIVAPDFPQLAKATFPEFVKWAPMSRCVNAHLDHPYTAKKLLLFNVRGKQVPVYYGGIENEAGWAGPNVNWVWFDEAARKNTRKAFDVLAARIRIGVQPQLFITTTPRGVNHWLYDLFERLDEFFDRAIMAELREAGYEGKVAEYFNASTEENKDNLDPYHYLILQGMYDDPNLRAQELGGQFVEMKGKVWENLSQENWTEDAEYVSGVPIEWWVDDGFTKGHPRVILFAQIIPPYINVFAEYTSLHEHAEDSIDAAMKLPWPMPSVAYVDSSAAELRSRLWQRGIDTVKATHDVEEGIKRTSPWICAGDGIRYLHFHTRCEFCRRELMAYVRSEETGKPLKAMDNAADAVRYGLWFKDREAILKEGEGLTQPAGRDIPSEVQTVAELAERLAAQPGQGDALQKLYALQMTINDVNVENADRMRMSLAHALGDSVSEEQLTAMLAQRL
jgi:hypothetical protein